MKYIRTKDTIYETKNVILISSVNDRIVWSQKINNPWFYIESVKQADTIEELCDEFVIVNRNSKTPYLLEDWQTQSLLKQRAKPDYIIEIYGAIWTDKGLIYVAKMNRKGDLELI